MLVAVAGTAILTSTGVNEGWYLEHLSDWGVAGDRIELSLRPGSRHGADVKPVTSPVSRGDQTGTTAMQPTNPANAQSRPAVR